MANILLLKFVIKFPINKIMQEEYLVLYQMKEKVDKVIVKSLLQRIFKRKNPN